MKPLAVHAGPHAMASPTAHNGAELTALNFVSVERKVRFQVSRRVADEAGLKMSAALLLLADRRRP